MSDLEMTTVEAAGTAVVRLTGTCDLRSHDALTSTLLAAVRTAPVVAVDLAGVTFIDSSNLQALVAAHLAARETGRNLYVVNATGSVATMLEITGVIELLAPPPGPRESAENRDG